MNVLTDPSSGSVCQEERPPSLAGHREHCGRPEEGGGEERSAPTDV